MRVIMISKALVVGAYHRKISEMAKLGMKIDLVIPTTWGNQMPEISKSADYNIHLLPISLSGKNHFHFYHGLSSFVNTLAPDILHIDEEPYSIVTYQAMKIAQRKNIGSLFYTWQNIYKKYPFPFSGIERYSYNVAQTAIAGNQEAKEILRRKGFQKEIFVIPQFGVDTKVFSRKDDGNIRENLFGSNKIEVIGYIGRLVEEKGILTLLEAFAKLKETSRLLIVGNGPFKGKIIESSNNLKIIDRVVILDSVPSEKVVNYLNCLDCLVLSSLTKLNWKEQFGRILIETMACEVPVIGSNSGEIPIVIGDAGLIFIEGDAADLREKIDSILSNSQMMEEYKKRGRRRVIENYTQKHIAEQTLQVYEYILKRSAL